MCVKGTRAVNFCCYAASLFLHTGQLLQLESSKLKNKMPTGLKLLPPPGWKYCKLYEGSTVYLYQTLDWILLTKMTINQWPKYQWCNRCNCTGAQTPSGAHEGRKKTKCSCLRYSTQNHHDLDD